MTAKIKQIHPVFVGEVSDVDLREPLSAEDVQIIDEGMARYGVLVFHGQNITDEQQAAFQPKFRGSWSCPAKFQISLSRKIAASARKWPTFQTSTRITNR